MSAVAPVKSGTSTRNREGDTAVFKVGQKVDPDLPQLIAISL